MSSKKKENTENEKKNLTKQTGCCPNIPGPKYKLRTLVGYEEHCHSKWREPAYSIGLKQSDRIPCIGPGPKYNVGKFPEGPYYSFPKDVYKDKIPCTPGPYMLPKDDCSPKYSIKGKWKQPCLPAISGPYSAYPLPKGPAFRIGLKPKDKPCQASPPMYDVGPVCLTRECSPMFSITPRRPAKLNCAGPGPKYLPKRLCHPQGYSFGLKHSPCEADNRTPCDELC